MSMREIKFRMWDEHKKEMREWDRIKEKPLQVLQYAAAPFVQYTGLKDKNGVEIFEEDVVRILYTDWPSQPREKNGQYSMSLEEYKKSISNVGKVVFSDAGFCIQFNDNGYTSSIFPGRHGEIEVIGNIYENPELLEKL